MQGGRILRFRRHERERVPYRLHPPYPEARRELLARQPAEGLAAAAATPDRGAVTPAPKPHGTAARRVERVWAVIVDLGMPNYLVSVFVFADGTIAIHASGGIHATGLHGARKVADAANVLLEETEDSLDAFSPIPDAAVVSLPEAGSAQVIARTRDGDMLLDGRLKSRRERVTVLATMALLLTDLARQAVFEGFERAEVGDVVYKLAPEYRSMRQALLDWEPRAAPADDSGRVVGVAVEYGEGDSVTSLFAFVDGSTSLYSSDGRISAGLSGRDGVADAAHELLAGVEAALAEFAPAEVVPLPQPGRVQFVVRTPPGATGESVQLLATVAAEGLAVPGHPLSRPFELANEIRRIAAAPRTG